MSKILVLLAPGAEEMEAVISVDVLRRAGLEVTLAGLDGPEPVTCSRRCVLSPDLALAEVSGDFDVLLLPGGGPGAQALAESATVQALLKKQAAAGRKIAAICAAPIALVAAGVGQGKRMTSHPAVRETVEGFATYSEDRVVVDGIFTTSRGPGTAFEFALSLIEQLAGQAKRDEVAGPMILP